MSHMQQVSILRVRLSNDWKETIPLEPFLDQDFSMQNGLFH